ncbi:hypothetical protein [Paenibacillus sp. RC67]|uniref:hypothetical protein n=1 Tax=Paenibacillus sp. RC67 TaxID=3039392 RepID=UPI0024AD7710|nr:hypothetical protein [Paenibacillus sp. RC67]
MTKPYTKPVIIAPHFECPIWVENNVIRKEYVILSADSSNEDVSLFLILLFGYNDINVQQTLEDSFNDLFKEDHIAVSGGIAFFENQNKKILPSCCCGLENWNEVHLSVKSKSSPWLGHNPSPEILYQNNLVRVWSDNPDSSVENRETPFSIEYDYEELLQSLDHSQKDLIAFINEPLFEWIYNKNNEIGIEMLQKMKKWFFDNT